MIPVSPPQCKAFLCVGSFIFSPLNLAVVPEICALLLLAFVLERSVVRRDGCDHKFILESSSEVCHAVMLPASPVEDFPVLGASYGDRRGDR